MSLDGSRRPRWCDGLMILFTFRPIARNVNYNRAIYLAPKMRASPTAKCETFSHILILLSPDNQRYRSNRVLYRVKFSAMRVSFGTQCILQISWSKIPLKK